MLAQHLATRLRAVRGAGEHFGAIGLDHGAPVGLLLVAGLDHVDGALEPEQRAGERQRAAPLASAGLRRQSADAFGLVVVGLSDSRIGLMAAGWAGAFVFVVHMRGRIERPLEAERPIEWGRAPQPVDVAYLVRDLDARLLR